MSISKDYEHLTNGDVAEHLASHRLVQEGQRQKRFENIRLPFGKQLTDLVRERLIAVAAERTAPAAPEPVLVTLEEALAQVSAITSLDQLIGAYATLLTGQATDVAGADEFTAALGELKTRTTLTGATVQVEVPGPERIVEVPAKGPTDEELVARYNSINSLESLEATLSAEHGEDVLMALVEMTDRVRASVAASQAPVEKVAETAAAEDEPAAQ